MKKLKSIIIFSAILLTMAVLFCLNASAAEWNDLGSFSYTFDEDTGVMVMRGEDAKVATHVFGYTSPYCYISECDCWDFPEDYTDEQMKVYNAAEKTRTLIIENGIVGFGWGALAHF